MKNETLFIHETGSITTQDILTVLRSLGIQPGDTLMIHSDLSVFGKIPERFLKNRTLFLKTVLGVLKEAVGTQGTLLMPTYSYSFLKGQDYDIRLSPSTAGILTEFFRKQKNVVRTDNPNLSFAVWGKYRDFFTSGLSKDSYGINSIFDKMKRKDAKVLLFGATFKGGTTFVHHIEHMTGVPYRYCKATRGVIKKGSRARIETFEHDMRMPDRYITIDGYKKAAALLERHGIYRRTTLGSREIELISSTVEYFRLGQAALKKDPLFFLNTKYTVAQNRYVHSGNPTRKRKDFVEDFFLPGLDSREVIFISNSKKDIISAHLADFLKEMPSQLKWSYRFFSSHRKKRFDNAIAVISLPDKAQKNLSRSLQEYLDRIYILEHDFIPMRVRGANLHRTTALHKTLFSLANGQRMLSQIGDSMKIDFKKVRAVTDQLLIRGVLCEFSDTTRYKTIS